VLATGVGLGVAECLIGTEATLDSMRIALYTRVSTSVQSVENQRHELRRVGEARHSDVVNEYSDDGISVARDRVHESKMALATEA